MEPNDRAIERAEQIIKVRSGLSTATEAASNLGISRKSYYQWEGKALKGMMAALANRFSGRPAPEVDREKEGLKKELSEAKDRIRILEQQLYVRQVMSMPMKEPKKKVQLDKTGGSDSGGCEGTHGCCVQAAVPAADTGVLQPDAVAMQNKTGGGTGQEAGAAEVRRP